MRCQVKSMKVTEAVKKIVSSRGVSVAAAKVANWCINAYNQAKNLFHFAGVKHETNTAFCKAFGEHLRKLREERGLSIRQFAAQCDLEHSQIQRIETGVINTTISMVYKIAEGLNLTHQELFDFTFPVQKKRPVKHGGRDDSN